jgi:signal transduction histidine kinase/AmiR/NasT family two-component response regulator/HPt (histidine-containing phosphotransfer) domain-containing protein
MPRLSPLSPPSGRRLGTILQGVLGLAILLTVWGGIWFLLAQEERSLTRDAIQTAALQEAGRVGVIRTVQLDDTRRREVTERYRADQAAFCIAGGFISVLALAGHGMLLTVRARMNRFQDALTGTLDAMSQGIVMVDENRRMLVINRRFVELLGVPPQIARPNGNFDNIVQWQLSHNELSGDVAANALSRMRNRIGGLDVSQPFYVRSRPNGTELEVRTAALASGGAVRTYTDITDQKRIERDLVAARDAAEAADRARADFLAMMSHEIRTPLNGIIGVAGLLLDMHPDPEERLYLDVIRKSGDQLLALVNDVLDFCRLDAGRLELELVTFDLPASLAGAVDLLAPAATARDLALTYELADDLPHWVVGDQGRLRQVLLNLINNAIKFTDQGEVHVRAFLQAEEPAGVRVAVEVSDTGIGIAPEACDQLFRPFSQIDTSVSRRFEGTGLGLAISRHLADRMNGSISVSSAPGRGSTFRFDLLLQPTDPPPVVPSAALRSPVSAVRRLRVLIAEDNSTNRLVATRMVERMGHRVDTVADGAEALSAVRSMPYDVVLMDVMMPVMDGLAATRLIRAEAGAAGRTRIIGLTASALPAQERACLDAGMNAFVTKPVTAGRLAEAIHAATRDISAAEAPAADPADAVSRAGGQLVGGVDASVAGAANMPRANAGWNGMLTGAATGEVAGRTDPGWADPGGADPGGADARGTQAGAPDTRAGNAGGADPNAGNAGAGNTGSADVRARDARPPNAKAAEAGAADAGPAETRARHAWPAVAGATDAGTADVGMADAAAGDRGTGRDRGDSKPAGTKAEQRAADLAASGMPGHIRWRTGLASGTSSTAAPASPPTITPISPTGRAPLGGQSPLIVDVAASAARPDIRTSGVTPPAAPLPAAELPKLPAILDAAFINGLAYDIGIDGVVEALGLFREDGPMRIAVIRRCVGRDPALLRREAHALAGASRNIGLVRLGEAASALQHAVEKMEPDIVQVEALAVLLEVSLQALDDWEKDTVPVA